MKRKTRAFVSLLLTVVLLFGSLPASAVRSAADALSAAFGGLFPSASAADMEGTCGEGLFWELDVQSGLLTVRGSGDMDDYTNETPSPWCEGGRHMLVRQVVLEDGVSRIGDYAFADCMSLQKVSIPSGVTEIGHSAFSDCKNLRTVEFAQQSSLARIGIFAFTPAD